MNAYERGFAEIYDKAGFSAFSERMIPYIGEILKQLNYQPKSVLDLACGTGTAAISFAKQGLKVYGVDGSAHMLKVARRKARKEKVRIRFLHSDMRSFTLPAKVDLAISLFDSLNYLTQLDDLVTVYRRVRLHLNKGGFFMFDMNTLYGIKYRWDNDVHLSWMGEDIFMIDLNNYDENTHTVTKTLTIFVKRKNELFERIRERHIERGYTVKEIKQAVKKAGLTLLNVYECLTYKEPKPETGRAFYICRKES
jgi:ubiquinone/menaquinone biosynthesis C-methylase UbiE